MLCAFDPFARNDKSQKITLCVVREETSCAYVACAYIACVGVACAYVAEPTSHFTDVNGKGVSVAAASAAKVRCGLVTPHGESPMDFLVNRPFLFGVRSAKALQHYDALASVVDSTKTDATFSTRKLKAAQANPK